jgi:hypothetical protein
MEKLVSLRNQQPQGILKVSSSVETLETVRIDGNLTSKMNTSCWSEMDSGKKFLIKISIDFLLLLVCKYKKTRI